MHIIESIIAYKVKKTISQAKKQTFSCYNHQGILKILLIGYSGKRNVGAEARCAEIIEDLRNQNLASQVEFSVLTLNPESSRPFYPDDVKLIPLSSIFFQDLLLACSDHHIAILAEGSCFTGVTSNVSALYFICAAGIMSAQGKPCVAYGVEAGPMPKSLIKILSNNCDQILFVARTNFSEKIAKQYGLITAKGTDTAWSITEKPIDPTKEPLRLNNGLIPTGPLLGVSLMNAFIRPIRPSLFKYLLGHLTGRWLNHYDKFYFYTNDNNRVRLYRKYLQAVSNAITAWVDETGGTPVLIEMEPMDQSCLQDLIELLPNNYSYISARNYNATEMTTILRKLDILLTSRYHAHVLTIPKGVPCVAISKDQRLATLFEDNDLTEYCISCYDEDIDDKVSKQLSKAWSLRKPIASKLKLSSIEYLAQQKNMAQFIGDHLKEVLCYADD